MSDSDILTRLNAALRGRYRIQSKLGEGGMATVYLAEDLRHERKVALKVLRPELAAVLGAERFLAEIKTTANLQHPHILPLFDSGEADSFLFYVMPYVEGESLREKLDRERQLPVEEALRIATDVAEALHAAHGQGVVHRDVKPANILLSQGRPLVADFGIALAVTAAGGGRLTETGLSLGTPYYMSPEQATADRDPGPQSDVYSLACMLYEMLTGDPPHTGSSAQAVLAKILTERPRPVTDLRQTVPPHVGAAVAKALERLPADRFETTEAFVKALGDPAFTHAGGAGATAGQLRTEDVAAGGRRRWVSLVPWGIAALATGVALWSLVDRPPAPQVTRAMLTSLEGQGFSEGDRPGQGGIALRPDGSELVYRGPNPRLLERNQLWRRPLNALEATPIPGTEGAVDPKFSPDGAFLSFAADDALAVVSIEGGSPLWLDDAGGRAHAWGDDGAIYWIQDNRLRRWVPGSEEVQDTDLDAAPDRPRTVSDVLPGSEAMLISSGGTLSVLDRGSGELRELGSGSWATYLETGHIVFSRADGTLLVQPFDPRSRIATGPSVATSAVVRTTGRSEYTVAGDGTLVYEPGFGGEADGQRLAWVDRDGVVDPIEWAGPGPVVYEGASVGPRGRRVAAGVRSPDQGGQTGDIWLLDLEAGSGIPLTRDGLSIRPDWHPVEERVAYVNRAADDHAVHWIAVDGSGRGERVVGLTSGAPPQVRWAGDGGELVIRMPGVSSRSIFRYVPGQEEAPTAWVDSEFMELDPQPSPDGNWLLYSSNRSGRSELYVQPYPDGGALTQISVQGGTRGAWSPDGREIFFWDEDDDLWSATVSPDGARLGVDTRELLLTLEGRGGQVFDVSPDGRFLVALDEGPPEESGRLVLVRNWVHEITEGR